LGGATRCGTIEKARKYLKPAEVGTLLNGLRRQATVLQELPEVQLSPDPDDNPILATAIARMADYLVTGDKRDLLVLGKVEMVQIIAAREFADILGGGISIMLAQCLRVQHYASMGVQITIRDVPEEVRDELASRAALQRKSMQEFLRGELERIASRPSLETWLRDVRERKAASGTRVRAADIVSARDADRR
jgi:hypothetical protein